MHYMYELFYLHFLILTNYIWLYNNLKIIFYYPNILYNTGIIKHTIKAQTP